MIDLFVELIAAFFAIVAEAAAAGGRRLFHDLGAILSGRKVRNRRRQGTVC
jgi:hypothetical protein